MSKRAFSGIQPSGKIHIGNYLGAVKRWVASQDETDSLFCIVDLHAITVPQKSEVLQSNIRELVTLLFAAGIDPDKATLFIQSHVAAHAELAWILNCVTPMGWMQRMTQFKDKSEKQRQNVSVGLFAYPALMAADILLYQTDVVPVGEDQKQHVELARDIAQRFNASFGETFTVPEPVIPEVGARIMSLIDPTKKMAKSEENAGHALYLLDTPDEITAKIAKATTDSQREICFDQNRPAIYNLLVIYELFTGMERKAIEERFSDKGYAFFKKELAQAVIEGLKPVQDRYRNLASDPAHIDQLLAKGADKVRPTAEETLQRVHKNLGLG